MLENYIAEEKSKFEFIRLISRNARNEDFFKGIKRSRSCKNPNIHNKSTCPILELNFLRILSWKRQSCRNLADPRTRDSSRLYICIEKTRKKEKKRKKGAWGAKCVKSSRASNDPLPFPPVFRLSRVPFFAGWMDIINRNGGILGEDCPRRVEKKKKREKRWWWKDRSW